MMSTVVATRFYICEVALALLVGTAAHAQQVDAEVRLGLGWVDNPYFDDDALRRVSALAGPLHEGAGRLVIESSLDAHHRLRGRVDGAVSYFGGDEPAWMRRAHLAGGWAHVRDTWALELMAFGRHYGIDRFATDARWGVGGSARFTHIIAPTWRWTIGAEWGWRRYPERIDVESDGTAQTDTRPALSTSLTAGSWKVAETRWWVVGHGSAFRIGSNATDLARDGASGRLGLLGAWRRWSWGTTLTGWALAFDTPARDDHGIQVDVFAGPSLAGGVGLRARSQWTRAESTVPSGRFGRWQAGLDVTWQWRRRTPVPAEALGVHRLADGRWRFVMRAPRAKRVELVGDFNGWSGGQHRLRRAEDGHWHIDLTLPPGRHTFMYLVDGLRWMTPDGTARIPDGFGREVGVVWIER